MTRTFLALATLALLAGCGHGAATTPTAAAKAIGCLPGDCPPKPTPTTAPCGPKPRPLAIGCLPGDCPPKPGPKPCR